MHKEKGNMVRLRIKEIPVLLKYLRANIKRAGGEEYVTDYVHFVPKPLVLNDQITDI